MTTKESQKTKKTRKADREVGGRQDVPPPANLCHPAEDIFSWHVIHFLAAVLIYMLKQRKFFFKTKVNYLYGKFSDNHTF